MKVTVVSMVNNSADIIESYIRLNGEFADNFVILNNFSTDRTCEILNKLIDEGYEIEIVEDNELGFNQGFKMTNLIKYVKRKYDSDYIIPLDDDEILSLNNPVEELRMIDEYNKMNTSVVPLTMGVKIRQLLQTLEPKHLFYVIWRTYVVQDCDYRNILGIKDINFCMDCPTTGLKKVIIPGEIVNDSFVIAEGNHDASSDNIVYRYIANVFRVAHFPIRSEQQVRNKVLIGWSNYLAQPNRNKLYGTHWEKMYNQIKHNESISEQQMVSMALESYNGAFDISSLEQMPLGYPDDCYRLKYTRENEINVWGNYIKYVERLIEQYRLMLGKND